jgi:hypothetical protein
MRNRHAFGNGNPALDSPEPVTSAASTVPVRRARARAHLSANDSQVDDYIALTEGWQGKNGEPLYAQTTASRSNVPLDMFAQQLTGGQMRELGNTLLKLADTLDETLDRAELRSRNHCMTQAGSIERKSSRLAQVALRMRNAAKRRSRFLASEWFGEPAWEMLLELFIQFADGTRVSTKSLVIASGAPDTTALRIIDRLVDAGIIERSPSQIDKRVTLVSLTRQGVIAVGSVLIDADR